MADRKDINPRRPIPSSGYNRLRENLKSNFGTDPGKFPESQGFPIKKVHFPHQIIEQV